MNELATTDTKDFIKQELLITCNKQESKGSFLKFINKPLRLEFLSAIFLKQHFENLSLIPHYKSEGLSVYTASGNKPCSLWTAQSYTEVSLIRDRSQSKMIPRHLKELIKIALILERNSVFLWLQIPMMVPKNMQNSLHSKTILIYATMLSMILSKKQKTAQNYCNSMMV